MKTMLDYVFEDLIDDLEKWHNNCEEDNEEESLKDLIDIMEDYKMSSEISLKELNNPKTQEDYDLEVHRENI